MRDQCPKGVCVVPFLLSAKKIDNKNVSAMFLKKRCFFLQTVGYVQLVLNSHSTVNVRDERTYSWSPVKNVRYELQRANHHGKNSACLQNGSAASDDRQLGGIVVKRLLLT